MDNTNSTSNYIDTDLKIIFWNSRSINSKKNELPEMLKNTDILVAVESWLDPNKVFSLPGFLTVRKDRCNSRGGGTIMLIRKNIAFKEITNISCPPNVDMAAVKITNMREPINIFGCYKPPELNLDQEDWDLIAENINRGGQNILMGDFNAHHQTWNCQSNDSNGTRLYNSSVKFDMFLHNYNTTTRVDFANR